MVVHGPIYQMKTGTATIIEVTGERDNIANVGIGTTSPGATLEVKVGGTILADAWIPRSSRRWKENIQPIDR